ncbi:MAG TPA: hypothetical protein HA299_06280 [Methermicoccus shengliensis]|uniref:Aerotolerance regulator N-terminal domain-containing protein n=1 Tax=Methermicoccus shengliensis TaxID=660064 RepID=A0A832RTI3_9EURY|nr:MAG: Uncharacterized protein XD46_0744 [Euryarchaeota archaeon 55_53]KUK30608.1 MAG: Uncharacterized protein XD62_0310 [Methanosarcinales archeaon 56_1174]MDI3488157.1 hypothetical protein [Methanosarcinales archaeon]HIH70198.1 hypothetical protein [Methermicoccus shengliensis]
MAAAGIIPIVILYLLKPRTVQRLVPSVMLFLRTKESKRLTSLFQRLIKDPLLLLQMLFVVLIALAAAGPFLPTSQAVVQGNVALVIDASASMQADGRFEEAIQRAHEMLGESNTIVLAEKLPILAVEGASPTKAAQVLSELRAGATSADLASAILLASQKLPRGEGTVVVLSDFSSYEGDSPITARTMAMADGHNVVFVKVGRASDNVGIVSGVLERAHAGYAYTYEVRNYMDRPVSFTVKITTEGGTVSERRELAAHESKTYTVSNVHTGTTRIELDVADGLKADNVAYISIPPTAKRDVLFVGRQGSPAHVALSVPPENNVLLGSREQGQMEFAGIDVVVLADEGLTTPEEMGIGIKTFLEAGGSVVVLGSDALLKDEVLKPLLPVEVVNTTNETVLMIKRSHELVEGIPFDEVSVKQSLGAIPKKGATVLVSSSDGSPVLAYWSVGRGKVVYLGMSDTGEWDNFPSKPEYPIFWLKLISWLTGVEDVNSYNLRAGALLTFDEEVLVRTPTQQLRTNTLLLDEVGIYTVGEQKYAVSMLNPRESDVNAVGVSVQDVERFSGEGAITRRQSGKLDLGWLAILGALTAALLEMVVLRRRGEL